MELLEFTETLSGEVDLAQRDEGLDLQRTPVEQAGDPEPFALPLLAHLGHRVEGVTRGPSGQGKGRFGSNRGSPRPS